MIATVRCETCKRERRVNIDPKNPPKKCQACLFKKGEWGRSFSIKIRPKGERRCRAS